MNKQEMNYLRRKISEVQTPMNESMPTSLIKNNVISRIMWHEFLMEKVPILDGEYLECYEYATSALLSQSMIFEIMQYKMEYVPSRCRNRFRSTIVSPNYFPGGKLNNGSRIIQPYGFNGQLFVQNRNLMQQWYTPNYITCMQEYQKSKEKLCDVNLYDVKLYNKLNIKQIGKHQSYYNLNGRFSYVSKLNENYIIHDSDSYNNDSPFNPKNDSLYRNLLLIQGHFDKAVELADSVVDSIFGDVLDIDDEKTYLDYLYLYRYILCNCKKPVQLYEEEDTKNNKRYMLLYSREKN